MSKRDKQLGAFSYLRKQQDYITDNLKSLSTIKQATKTLSNNNYLSEDLKNRFSNLAIIFNSIHKQAVKELMNKEKQFLDKYIDEINQN